MCDTCNANAVTTYYESHVLCRANRKGENNRLTTKTFEGIAPQLDIARRQQYSKV